MTFYFIYFFFFCNKINLSCNPTFPGTFKSIFVFMFYVFNRDSCIRLCTTLILWVHQDGGMGAEGSARIPSLHLSLLRPMWVIFITKTKQIKRVKEMLCVWTSSGSPVTTARLVPGSYAPLSFLVPVLVDEVGCVDDNPEALLVAQQHHFPTEPGKGPKALTLL